MGVEVAILKNREKKKDQSERKSKMKNENKDRRRKNSIISGQNVVIFSKVN